MVGYMLGYLSEVSGTDLLVATAGTHVVEGQPMGRRTRAGLAAIEELAAAPVSRHRSRQVAEADLERATLVVAMEAAHVRYVRRSHPGAAPRTVTLRRLCRELSPPPGSLVDRVAALGAAEVQLTDDEEVADPAGLEEDAYVACALELWALCQALIARL